MYTCMQQVYGTFMLINKHSKCNMYMVLSINGSFCVRTCMWQIQCNLVHITIILVVYVVIQFNANYVSGSNNG